MAKHQGLNATWATEFTSGSGTYTQVGQVISIDPPKYSVSTEDVTGVGDTYVQKLAGIIDAGQATVTVHYDPANSSHVSLKAAIESMATLSHRIVFGPSGATKTWTFSGHFTAWEPQALERSAYQQLSFTVDITGTYTVT